MKHLFRNIVGSISFFTLCGCSTLSTIVDTREKNELYLRGVFTWWEAEKNFRFIKNNNSSLAVTIELIADGQPYDFKIADALWTPKLNCGYMNKENDEVLKLNIPVKAKCHANSQNFKFMPTTTAKYEFIFKLDGDDTATLTILKAQ